MFRYDYCVVERVDGGGSRTLRTLRTTDAVYGVIITGCVGSSRARQRSLMEGQLNGRLAHVFFEDVGSVRALE